MEENYFNSVHFGITSKCNASCYICNRNCVSSYPLNIEISKEIFDKVYPYTKQVGLMGGFGDFINHKDSLYFPKILLAHNKKFMIETNAGIRDEKYWKDLAKLAKDEDHHVQFSIDDIKNDINPYRKTKTERVLTNLKTFIDAGGCAYVKIIVFNFNYKYLNEMSEYFKSIGVIKVFKQYSTNYMMEGELSCPADYPHKQGTHPYLKKLNNSLNIDFSFCPWVKGKWCYIFENGEVHNCCSIFILGHVETYHPEKLKLMSDLTTKEDYKDELIDLYLKNRDLINLNNDGVTLESAYNNEYNAYLRKNFKDIPRCNYRCKTYKVIDTNNITGSVEI